VAPEFKEVVADTDLLQAKHISPDLDQGLFNRIAWSDKERFSFWLYLNPGGRESPTIYFSMSSQRKCL
jgi:hypothetical protein